MKIKFIRILSVGLVLGINLQMLFAQNQQKQNLNQEKERLIDGIELGNKNIFNYSGEGLNEYHYKGLLIEHLKMQDLLQPEYRESFFRFLEELNGEEARFIPELFTAFLILKLEQDLKYNRDSNAFYLLSEVYRRRSIASRVMDMLEQFVMELFLLDQKFFISQSTKYQNTHLIDYAMYSLYRRLVKESYFTINNARVNLKKGQLFIYDHPNSSFLNDENLQARINQQPKEAVFFTPTMRDAARQKQNCQDQNENCQELEKNVRYFPNIQNLWNNNKLISSLTKDEKDIYDKHIYPVLKSAIIRNYHVNAPDGYVNFREKPNAKSKILTIIPNGEYVCFLGDADNWVKVYYTQKDKRIEGYIYKSQLEER